MTQGTIEMLRRDLATVLDARDKFRQTRDPADARLGAAANKRIIEHVADLLHEADWARREKESRNNQSCCNFCHAPGPCACAERGGQ